MSHSADKHQFHKYSYSAENEAKVGSSIFDTPTAVRPKRAGTDPGEVSHCNVGIDELSTPRKFPTPRIELGTPYKECKGYSYIGDNSTLHSKVHSTAEMVTKPDTERRVLSLPSTLHHVRHESTQDSASTSSPKEITNSLTPRVTEHGDSQVADPDLASTVSTSDMLAGIGKLSSLLASLNVQDGTENKESHKLASRQTMRFADVEAQVDGFLDTLQRWTMQTGDTSVLQSLSKDIAMLSSNIGFSPTQLGGQDLSIFPQHIAISSEQSPSSNAENSNTSGQNRKGNRKGKEASSQDRHDTKFAERGSKKSGKLRCPLYFGEEHQQCEKLHTFPRDLM